MNELKTTPWIISLIVILLLAPISVDLGVVPLTLQTFVLFIAFSLFSWRGSLILGLVYLFLGAVGLPVFGGYTSGWEKLIGPTSGFLWGFLLCARYLAWETSRSEFHFFQAMLAFLKAHALLLIPGFLVLYFQVEGADLWATLVRLIPGILIKSILGGTIAALLRNRILESRRFS